MFITHVKDQLLKIQSKQRVEEKNTQQEFATLKS